MKLHISKQDKNLLLELLGAFMLSIAFFYVDIVSMIAGFFGFLIVIDLINTNLRRINHG